MRFSPSLANNLQIEFALSLCALLSVHNESRKVEPMCLIANEYVLLYYVHLLDEHK